MTRNITVRRAEPEDFAAVQAIYAAPRAQAGTLQLPFPSLDLWRQRLQTVDPNAHILVACADGEVVGQLGLHVSPRPRRRHDDWQGRGVGSALLGAALELADRWLQVRRVELQVYSDNAPAIALYKRHGFGEEGRHVDFAFRDGAYVDALTMARVDVSRRRAATLSCTSMRPAIHDGGTRRLPCDSWKPTSSTAGA